MLFNEKELQALVKGESQEELIGRIKQLFRLTSVSPARIKAMETKKFVL